MPDNNELSERELEILLLVATGASNKEIAQKLFISTNTVKVHLRNIFAKIEVTSRTEAAMYAVRLGLVQPDTGEARAEEATGPFSQVSVVETSPPLRKNLIWLAALGSLVILGVLIASFLLMRQPAMLAATASPTLADLPDLPTAAPRWQDLAAMPTARDGLAVTAYEGQIYAIGGETPQGVTGVVERFDPTSNAWTERTPKPLAVSDVSAAVLGGLVYVPGGREASGAVTDVMEIYDPRNDTWQVGAPLPAAMSAYALVTYEGKIYLFGGWDGQRYLNSTYEYDPENDRWRARTPMPTARGFAGAGVSGNKIYIVGGKNEGGPVTANEQYIPEDDDRGTDPWQKRAAMPEARYAMGVASIADIIQVVGGAGEGNAALPPLEYIPEGDNWQVFENPLTRPWSHLGIVPLGTRLYVLGGQLGGELSQRNMAYQAIYTIIIPVIR